MEDIMTCPVILIEEEDWIVAKEITTDIASQGKTIKIRQLVNHGLFLQLLWRCVCKCRQSILL